MTGTAPATQTMVAVLEGYAAMRPDEPCLTVDDETVTWRGLLELSRSAAAFLAGRGVTAGDIVALKLDNSPFQFACCFGAWLLGATPLPLPAGMVASELAEIVQVAGVAVVVDERQALAPVVEPVEPAPLPRAWKAMPSGGSTGRPKVVLALKPPVASVDIDPFGIGDVPAMLVSGPLYHNTPMVMSFEGLMHGKHVVMMARFDPGRAVALIVAHHVGWMSMVPTMMARLQRVPDATLRPALVGVRRLWHTGSVCPPWLKERFIDLLGPEAVTEIYGNTEATAATVIRGDEWLRHPGSVGRPWTGEFMIVDPDGAQCPPGTVGEIYCRPSGQPPFEYLGVTRRATMPDGWEAFGDLGYLTGDGYLYLVDRRTDLIITGGENVYPAEVETVLSRYPGVLDVAVFGEDDDDLGKRVAAVVQVDEPVSEHELAEYAARELTRYKCPRAYHFTTTTFRNEAGKVRRTALADFVARTPS
jgi:bile acid-coenzyme A ligase